MARTPSPAATPAANCGRWASTTVQPNPPPRGGYRTGRTHSTGPHAPHPCDILVFNATPRLDVDVDGHEAETVVLVV